MRSTATTAWDYADDCVFVAHRRGKLIDSDFGEFLEDVLAQTAVRRVIVRASEAAPRADHRAALLRWYKANGVRGAVLTDSVLARGGVTALGWFGVAIRAFPSEHWPKARTMMSSVIAGVDRVRA